MLSNLKSDLMRSRNNATIGDIMIESLADDSIKSVFLDSIDGMLLGSEEDPELEKEVQDIPEFKGLYVDENDIPDEITEESISQIPELEL